MSEHTTDAVQTAQPAETNPAGNSLATANPNTIPLSVPIARKGGDVTAITLRKPDAGELRGLSLNSLLQSNVDDLIVLLPRISSPALIEHEVARMDVADLVQVAGKVACFLLGKQAPTSPSRTE